MTNQRTIIHLEMNGQHEYFWSPGSLYDKHTSDEIGISHAGLNNYFSQHCKEGNECVYINKKCIIRKGKIHVKSSTRGRKETIDTTNTQHDTPLE